MKVLDSGTKEDILKLTELALTEDVGTAQLSDAMDCTTLAIVPEDVVASASFVSRESGIVAGSELVNVILSHFAPEIELEIHIRDGQSISDGHPIATMKGLSRSILMMERTCLNFLCRLSGIATLTSSFVAKIQGTRAKILDTRKTTPGWRRIEKYAVHCGGGTNHRMGLYDAVMIKDNHLAMYGSHIGNHQLSVSQAVDMAKKWVDENQSQLSAGIQTVVQIEVDTIEQLKIALTAGPDIVLLDNMSNQQLLEGVNLRNKIAPGVLLEASGGVKLNTVGEIAKTGVDRISVGALTHSAANFDIGLDWLFNDPLQSKDDFQPNH